MSTRARLFHSHERGRGDEDWYYLCHYPDSGRVTVLHKWSHRVGDDYEPGSKEYELDAFLNAAHRGTAQAKLVALIATLTDES